MNITKKRLVQLRQSINELGERHEEYNRKIEIQIGDLSREVLDIIEPPKKGYLRFKTTNGWVSFKKTKKGLKQVGK